MKKIFLKTGSLFLIMAFSLGAFAQENICKTHGSKTPQVFNQLSESKNTYTVPIVYHVLHDGTGNDWLPTELELEQITDSVSLNFRKFGVSDINREIFDTIWADSNIDFCITEIDENGQATNGVVYNNIGHNFMYGDFSSHLSEVDFWDTEQFLNIVIIYQGSNTETSGGMTVSRPNFPPDGTVIPEGADNHIVVNRGFVRNNFVNMLSHECGHYFGLYHLFEDEELTEDTPCAETNWNHLNYSTCNPDWLNDNTCDDVAAGNTYWEDINPPDMIENFMDYTFACDKMYTNQQVNYMRNYLQTNYPGFINHNKCNSIVQVPAVSRQNEISIFPNPAKDEIYVVGNNISTIEIINLNGTIIKTQTISNKTCKIDVSELSKGLYFIKIYSDYGMKTEKIVIE